MSWPSSTREYRPGPRMRSGVEERAKDLLIDGRKVTALADHAGIVGGDDLRAHRALHNLADLLP